MSKIFTEVLLKAFLSIISFLINSTTATLSATIATLLPDFTNAITRLTDFIDSSIFRLIPWFLNLIPNYTRGVIILYLEVLIGFFSVYIIYIAIYLLIHLISKITDIIT